VGTNASTAVKVANDAQSGGSLPIAVTIDGTSNQTNMGTLSQTLAKFVRNHDSLNFPAGVQIQGSCGGTATFSNSNYPQSGSFSTTITFSNYCDSSVDATLSFSGKVVYSTPDVNGVAFTMTFSNFVITQNGQTTTVNSMTYSCDSNYVCSFSSDYVGADGQVYRTADFSITGDATNGFNGTMTFYDPTYGSVDVTITGITYGSCGDFPDGGIIDIAGSGGSSASITFASNCTYSGTWDDGAGGSGSFSGTVN